MAVSTLDVAGPSGPVEEDGGRPFRWSRALITFLLLWAIAAAWMVLVGLLLWVGYHADDPGAPLLLFLLTVGLAVVGLLMVVMRALLRQATDLRTDLEAVI